MEYQYASKCQLQAYLFLRSDLIIFKIYTLLFGTAGLITKDLFIVPEISQDPSEDPTDKRIGVFEVRRNCLRHK